MNIKTIIAAAAIALAPAFAFAQSLEANKAQSDNLDMKIDIVQAEIKTLKAKKKAEPANLQHEADLAAKQAELKKLVCNRRCEAACTRGAGEEDL